MSEYQIRFHCELLEDMHCGSGEGHLDLVDDMHARDSQGRPVCWSSTLLGLLRDQAEQLADLGYAQPKTVRSIFGSEGADSQRRVLASSLHFAHPDAGSPAFLQRTQTAREVGGRRPEDQTLRTLELARAGQVAHGELRLSGDSEDLELLGLCLRRLRSLGGDKTRGLGRIRVIVETPVSAPPAPPLALNGPGQLRLRLRNLDPVMIPRTAHPGNLLVTETFLPGTAVRGMLLTALRQAGAPDQALETLAKPDCARFSPGYPIPSGEPLPQLALPLPFSVQACKQSRMPVHGGRLGAPWWLHDRHGIQDLEASIPERRDALLAADQEQEPDYKRIKQELYVCKTLEGQWHEVAPRTSHRMRNRIPVQRQGRMGDSRRKDLSDEEAQQDAGSLFTETLLAEDQDFLVTIDLDHAGAQAFAEHAAPYCGPSEPADRSWLRLGRGGRAVRVEALEWAPASPETAASPPDLVVRDEAGQSWFGFTLTLLTDLIARTPDLRFASSLDPRGWALLAGIEPPGDQLRIVRAYSETRIVHGFNRTAGNRRMPALAIRAGSAFCIEGPVASDVQRFRSELSKALARRKGLGERREEGYGRVELDLGYHRLDGTLTAARNGQAGEPPSQNSGAREDLYRAVLEAEAVLAESLRLTGSDHGPLRGPSRTQWQALRHHLERPGGPSALSLLQRIAGKPQPAWRIEVSGQPLVDWLIDQLGQPAASHDSSLFLAELARCTSVRLQDVEQAEELPQ